MAVTPADIATALRRSTPDDATEAQWAMWIDDAEMLLSLGDGRHQGLGDLSALDQAKLDYVVRQAVLALARRPDDATRVDVQVDGMSTSRTYASGKGEVTISDVWWDLLSPSLNDSGAFSVEPYGQPDYGCYLP